MTQNLEFLTGSNSTFIAELYEKYLQNPASVDASWVTFFQDLEADASAILQDIQGASWCPRQTKVLNQVDEEELAKKKAKKKATGIDEEMLRAESLDSVRAMMLIRAYRVRGHLHAKLDPLGLQYYPEHPELDPSSYGFEDGDLDKEIHIYGALGFEKAKLSEIINFLENTYCRNVGIEFMHIQDPDQKQWIQEYIERTGNKPSLSKEEKKTALKHLIAAQGFEQFLNKKYKGTKRFGLDGAEAAIPALEEVIEVAASLGVQEFVLGMPHRGRLNVLANILEKPYKEIFSEFEGCVITDEDFQGSGDVKYHLGSSSDRVIGENAVHLSLTANPSHLEAVNPVVLGKVRAKMNQVDDSEGEKAMALLLHGDAAFAGQGIVAEGLMMSQLKGYRTGGTVHLIVNNQIGFTTTPQYSRSGAYSSDVGKMVQAPVFHINGDDLEAVLHATRMATEFRQKFKKDVIIDLICYRRYGHNESDEPMFTQPIMYNQIKDHPSVLQIYKDQLVSEGQFTAEEIDAEIQDFQSHLETQFKEALKFKKDKLDWLEGQWTGLSKAKEGPNRGKTSVSVKKFKEIGGKLTDVPEDYTFNKKLLRQLNTKKNAIESGKGIDWATAEALAFGTLVDEGFGVRLSGQDCGRGTFSQRHAIWVDQNDERRYIPLCHVHDEQGRFEVYDSPLSEMGVLGYEYGYSLADPNMLVLWEAQFGDFSNGAQIIIDQFISSGESKWLRMSGLVMLLPHGYEGQGPEHSSARMERYLQLCGEDNMQVANCTTPANYYHILKRQLCREFRKPLVIMTPKSLLRHKDCVSNIEDFTGKSTFHRVLYNWDVIKDPKKVKRVVCCSGKVYYDLLQKVQEEKINDVALVRLEQLYPFPDEPILEEFARYPDDAEVIWCQEEPKNMGSWNFVLPYFIEMLQKKKGKQLLPTYCGRAEAASPATGFGQVHVAQQNKIVCDALGIKTKKK